MARETRTEANEAFFHARVCVAIARERAIQLYGIGTAILTGFEPTFEISRCRAVLAQIFATLRVRGKNA